MPPVHMSVSVIVATATLFMHTLAGSPQVEEPEIPFYPLCFVCFVPHTFKMFSTIEGLPIMMQGIKTQLTSCFLPVFLYDVCLSCPDCLRVSI